MTSITSNECYKLNDYPGVLNNAVKDLVATTINYSFENADGEKWMGFTNDMERSIHIIRGGVREL